MGVATVLTRATFREVAKHAFARPSATRRIRSRASPIRGRLVADRRAPFDDAENTSVPMRPARWLTSRQRVVAAAERQGCPRTDSTPKEGVTTRRCRGCASPPRRPHRAPRCLPRGACAGRSSRRDVRAAVGSGGTGTGAGRGCWRHGGDEGGTCFEIICPSRSPNYGTGIVPRHTSPTLEAHAAPCPPSYGTSAHRADRRDASYLINDPERRTDAHNDSANHVGAHRDGYTCGRCRWCQRGV